MLKEQATPNTGAITNINTTLGTHTTSISNINTTINPYASHFSVIKERINNMISFQGVVGMSAHQNHITSVSAIPDGVTSVSIPLNCTG